MLRVLITSFIVLAATLGGLSASLGQGLIGSKGLSLCPSAVAVNSTTISVDGHDIIRTTFECPDDSLSVNTILPELVHTSPLDNHNSLNSRSAAECRSTVQGVCQCGQPTTCTCVSPTAAAPNGNDCAILIDSMRVIPQISGATFTVQPSTFELVQFESCAMEWSNLGLQRGPLEYCWDEAVALTGLSNQDCLEAGVSSGASCTPSDSLWNLSLLRIGS